MKVFTDMPWSTCRRLVQKKNGEKNDFPTETRVIIVGFFDGLWSVGTRFRH